MTPVIFTCPDCKSLLDGFTCPKCRRTIQRVDSIYQFCADPAVQLEGDDEYIGYDGIGEDFEPAVRFWDANNTERYGVYEACANLVAEKLGRDLIALDLGAGLGTASLPLAKNGIFTVAGDISNVMLKTAVKRNHGRYENLLCAKMNAYDIPVAESSVDIVIENAMLHLVNNPEKVIREIVRVLKPDGKLIRFGSYPQQLSDDEKKLNAACNAVLDDISDMYYSKLAELGHSAVWFDNQANEVLENYFDHPYTETAEGFSEVFTDKLKFRLHRLKTGAHSDLQNTPKKWISAAWKTADRYARNKYGDGYADIKSFSRYGACVNIYTKK